ncbi:MAG: tetratricopeptide repeat protein [Tenuifilaceae bacterium]
MSQIKLVFLFLFFSLVVSFNCLGQDQLKSILESNNPEIILNYAEEKGIKSEALKELANKALSLLSDSENSTLIAKAYQILGRSFFLQGQYNSAIEALSKSIEYYKEINDSTELARSLNMAGVCFQQKGDYSQAIEYLHKALILREKLDDKSLYAATLNNLGIVYRLTGQFEQSLNYYKKGYAIFKEIDDKSGYSTIESNIGLIYNNQENYEEALNWFLKALDTKKILKDTLSLADNYDNLGRVNFKIANYPKALEYFTEALKLYQKSNHPRGEATCSSNIASLYLTIGNLDNAIAYLNQSQQIAESIQDNIILKNNYHLFSEYYLTKGNYNKSKEMFNKYSEVVEKLFGSQVSQQVAVMTVKYETEQKEYQNKLLQANLEIEKVKLDRSKDIQLLSIVIIVIITFSLIRTLYLFRNLRRSKKEIESFNLKLKTLNEELENNVEARTKELSDALARAEESDKLKSAFLTNMSHEIRTPMNGIIGFAKILEDETLPVDIRKRYVDIINRQGQNLLQIINDIISISKIESGQLTVKKSICNINVILSDLYTLFSSKKNLNQNINIELRVVKSLGDNNCYILSDPIRLEQILSNLIDNAYKFTNEGYIEFGYHVLGPRTIKFYVKDSGYGIPEDQFNRIFSRFYRYSHINQSLSSGTGLGLAISKGLTDLLGGELTVESKLGEGSVFNLKIPYIPIDSTLDKPKDIKTRAFDSNNWSEKMILVVEDDLISYLYLETLLAKSGVNLIHVKNGEDAIEVCQINDKIDMILMDMQLPFISGYETTHEIKSFRKNIPIIAQTANVMNNEREKCILAGCDDYISKPIDPDEFMLILTKYFS